MDIDIDNFYQNIDKICKHIDESEFISIDLEFSGK
jgi:hypothetical protein